ncbi:hypothetical protein P8452_57898 [Trifolium repens]|nr:hypothetical protein P8452_57898 [Trifolium repens]
MSSRVDNYRTETTEQVKCVCNLFISTSLPLIALLPQFSTYSTLLLLLFKNSSSSATTSSLFTSRAIA